MDIRDIKADYLRKNIGLCLQEPFLFSRTIGENIGITQHDMPMEEIRRAANIACVDEAIIEFTKGYNTIVGERGVTLSGGQKQRVALARALVNRPNIIIADEPTAALDKAAADEIMEVMKSLNSIGKTIVIVTHDRTVAEKCRRIVELSDGKIISDRTIA